MHLNCFSLSWHSFLRVEECISQGKDSLLVDPDPNLLYTKRKLAKQGYELFISIWTRFARWNTEVVFYNEVLQFFLVLVDGACEAKFTTETSRDKLLYIRTFFCLQFLLRVTWVKMQRAYLCGLCEFEMRANISPYFHLPFLSKIVLLHLGKQTI